MCCDFRILTQDAVMGLNEVSIGISVPAMWIKLMASLIGQGAAFKLCQFGTNVNAQRAKLIGLADEIVLQSTDLESKCVEIVTKCLKLPDTGRQITKHSCRIELFSEWSSDARLQVEAEHGWKMLSMPSTVKFMTQVMQRLKSKI